MTYCAKEGGLSRKSEAVEFAKWYHEKQTFYGETISDVGTLYDEWVSLCWSKCLECPPRKPGKGLNSEEPAKCLKQCSQKTDQQREGCRAKTTCFEILSDLNYKSWKEKGGQQRNA